MDSPLKVLYMICDLVWLAKQRDLPTDNVVPLPTHNIDFYMENQ